MRHGALSEVGLCLMTHIEAVEAVKAGQLCIAGPPIADLDLSLLYLKRRARDPLVKAILNAIASAWQANGLTAPSSSRDTIKNTL